MSAFPYRWVRVLLRGSLAATGRGHRTHGAVVAGLLGIDTRDDRNPDVMRLAAELGVAVVMPGERVPDGPHIRFEEDAGPSPHPNRVEIDAETLDGRHVHLTGNSVGGGNVEILTLAADDTEIPPLLPREEDDEPGASPPALPLTDEQWDRFQAAGDELQQIVGQYGPRAPHASRPTLAALTALAHQINLDPGRFALCLEAAVRGATPEEAWTDAVGLYRKWQKQVMRGREGAHRLQFLSGDWARRLMENPHRVLMGELPWQVFVAAIGIQELNGAGGKVTAAPTGGASGTVPACVVETASHLGADETDGAFAVLVSGLVGFVAFGRGSVSGAAAGCGGEIGIAAMMAAGAVAWLLRGGWAEVDTAAAMASLPWQGTECSPTFGLVEWPCAPRNGHAAVGAVVSAITAFSVRAPYPADRMMDVIFAVGGSLPRGVQETNEGHHAEGLLGCFAARCAGCQTCRRK